MISEDNFLGSFQAPFKALVEELDGLTVADLDPVGTIIIKTSPDAVTRHQLMSNIMMQSPKTSTLAVFCDSVIDQASGYRAAVLNSLQFTQQIAD